VHGNFHFITTDSCVNELHFSVSLPHYEMKRHPTHRALPRSRWPNESVSQVIENDAYGGEDAYMITSSGFEPIASVSDSRPCPASFQNLVRLGSCQDTSAQRRNQVNCFLDRFCRPIKTHDPGPSAQDVVPVICHGFVLAQFAHSWGCPIPHRCHKNDFLKTHLCRRKCVQRQVIALADSVVIWLSEILWRQRIPVAC
jgi:hypothetical protein